jgi:predicted alpha/beta-hydrolase family hydrolase
MKYIYLPGYSLKNLDELEAITGILTQNNYDTLVYKWRHWSDENEKWDPDYDAGKIIQASQDSNEITIIAKSLGTHIAVKLADKIRDKVKLIILMGIPINDLDDGEKSDYIKTLTGLNIPIYLIHNRKDNHGSLHQVQELLKAVRYDLIIKESDDHRYNYPEDVLKIITGNL